VEEHPFRMVDRSAMLDYKTPVKKPLRGIRGEEERLRGKIAAVTRRMKKTGRSPYKFSGMRVTSGTIQQRVPNDRKDLWTRGHTLAVVYKRRELSVGECFK